MAEMRRLTLRESLILIAILALAAGARAGYLMSCAENASSRPSGRGNHAGRSGNPRYQSQGQGPIRQPCSVRRRGGVHGACGPRLSLADVGHGAYGWDGGTRRRSALASIRSGNAHGRALLSFRTAGISQSCRRLPNRVAVRSAPLLDHRHGGARRWGDSDILAGFRAIPRRTLPRRATRCRVFCSACRFRRWPSCGQHCCRSPLWRWHGSCGAAGP